MRKLVTVCLGIAIAMFGVNLTFSQGQSQQGQSPSGGDMVKEGQQFFQQNCARCHNADSTETKTGPGLKGLFKRDQLPVSGRPVNEENVHNQLVKPFKDMPSFANTPEKTRKAVVSYLKTL